jgi:poly(3-hydroxybutyrate) depolymerase
VHVHGRVDRNVLYDGGETQEGINKGRRDTSVNESITFWITQNNCSKTPVLEQSVNDKVILTKYINGNNRSEVNLVTIMNQNHYWYNMNRDVASERFYGQSLAEMIWTLLKQYSK